MNVFDIVVEYQSLMNQLEDNGGELTPELATALDINQENLDKKIHAYYYVIKTKEAEATLAKDEMLRLSDVIVAKSNVVKRLKKLVDLAVETFGVVKSKAVNKSLTFTDLSVWQKKTEALNIDGTIDDERFCNKEINFSLSYDDANRLQALLDTIIITENKFNPNITVSIIKDKLKTWLIDNEEIHKELRKKASEITTVEFEDNPDGHNIIEVGKEETQEDKDLKIILAAEVKHNSTVIFK